MTDETSINETQETFSDENRQQTDWKAALSELAEGLRRLPSSDPLVERLTIHFDEILWVTTQGFWGDQSLESFITEVADAVGRLVEVYEEHLWSACG